MAELAPDHRVGTEDAALECLVGSCEARMDLIERSLDLRDRADVQGPERRVSDGGTASGTGEPC
jgi:hypothetical protein